MRKISYIASAVAIVMMAAACKDKQTAATVGQPDTASVDTVGARSTALANYIRYVDTQRILSEYSLAKEVAQADSAAQIQLAALQNQLSTSLNNRAQSIQEKMQRNGYLNESAYNADVASLQKAQQDAENRVAQRQRDYATDLMAKQQQLHDSIKSVIDHICQINKLDAVLNDQAGLYFNPALDITDEVVAELNRRYTAKQ